MIKIVCIGYRSWAISIYSELKKNKNYKVLILKKKKLI